jgi:hypothetical protein
MPRSTSESDTVSDSNSDSDESIDKSSRKCEKFSCKRVMEEQEDGELSLPVDPKHEVEEVPDNDGQDEIPGEPKEPKPPKRDVDVTEFKVSSTSSRKIRKSIPKFFVKSKAKKLGERFQQRILRNLRQCFVLTLFKATNKAKYQDNIFFFFCINNTDGFFIYLKNPCSIFFSHLKNCYHFFRIFQN